MPILKRSLYERHRRQMAYDKYREEGETVVLEKPVEKVNTICPEEPQEVVKPSIDTSLFEQIDWKELLNGPNCPICNKSVEDYRSKNHPQRSLNLHIRHCYRKNVRDKNI